MDDLISRQAAIDAFVKYVADGYAESPNDFDGYIGIIKALPTAEKKGRWVYDEERGATGIYAICTACNEMIYQTGEFNYCPSCGTKMEE